MHLIVRTYERPLIGCVLVFGEQLADQPDKENITVLETG